MEGVGLDGLLGGAWDLVTTYNWDYNPPYTWGIRLFRGTISKRISPVISSYQVP